MILLFKAYLAFISTYYYILDILLFFCYSCQDVLCTMDKYYSYIGDKHNNL